MSLLASLRLLCGRYLRRRDSERELEEELLCHIERRTEHLERSGVSHREALRQACVEFGGRERVKEECREALPGRLLDAAWQDVRFSVRTLTKQPGFALVAIATIAIGMGMSTIMLSIVHGVLLRPLPYPNAERLYAIYASSQSTGQTRIAASGPDVSDYIEQNRSFTHLAGYLPRFTFTWTGDGEPKIVTCTAGTPDFFPALGVRPYLGRFYQPDEYKQLEINATVVSYRFWKTQLGGDPNVIGRVVHFEGGTQTIVGVAPSMSDLFPDTDVLPTLTLNPSWPFMQWRANKFLRVIGELRPGVTPAMAEQDLTGIIRRAPEEPRDVRVQLVPLKDDLVGNSRMPLVATLCASALILLVASINVAALLLARAVKRQPEMALRLSLGAGKARLAQQLITEAAVLTAAGSVLGVILASNALQLLARADNLPLPRLDSVRLNAPALITTILIVTATTLIFGWLPVLSFVRLPLFSALRSRGGGVGARRRLSLPALVVTEIACSVVLTVSVGLLAHSFWRVMHVDRGFEPRSLFRVYLRSDSPPNEPEALRRYNNKAFSFWRALLQETGSLAGIRAAAITDWRPGRGAATASLIFDDQPSDPARSPHIEGSWVSASFFQTVGAQLLKGRLFTEHDDENAPAVVLINAEAARRFWPGENPLGKRIAINYTGPGRRTNGDAPPRWREIVGVVGTIKHGPLDSPSAPAVYMPYVQDETSHDMSALNLLVRTEGNVIGLAESLRDRIHALRPDQPVQGIDGVEAMESQSVASRRYTLLLLGSFAAVALALSAIGLYGVISYVTAQRTREFGVRVALGATRGRIASEVLRGGARLIAAGSLIGIVVALLITRALSALLFDVTPLDPFSYSAAVALLGAIALCACLIPAWRASRVDPLIAMQCE